jgi:hypothetical protein
MCERCNREGAEGYWWKYYQKETGTGKKYEDEHFILLCSECADFIKKNDTRLISIDKLTQRRIEELIER